MALDHQFLQDIGAGGIGTGLALLAAGQVQLVEQDLAKLFGAADIEALAGQFVDARLKDRHGIGEFA